MKEGRNYPYFKYGEKVICVEIPNEYDIFSGEKLIKGQIYEVIHPQCTPSGILVKNETGKETWCRYHHVFEWL